MNKFIYLFILLYSAPCALIAQSGYQPTKENFEARKEFQDNKFGIFIHWGLYSMMGDGEWILHNKNLNHEEYELLAGAFYPSKFNAAKWVSHVKAAGAKYICITSRHHDGFSLFHTKYSPYNAVDATPFGRDILKELADECHKQGIKLHFYYSHLDWGRDDYYPLGRTGRGTGRTTQGEWKTYYQFMNNQLTELLTNYGEIGAIWFDGVWDQEANPDFDWGLEEQYKLIHQLQPSCLVANNHHITPFPGEDIQIFERDLPGENKAGLSGQEVSRLPLETCETMNKTWGYRMHDTAYKSSETLIHYLVKAAGKDANLLLNVGPRPNGEFPDKAIEHLKEMGEWLNQYGETIYGTRAELVPPRDWGVCTHKGNKLYVHILSLQDNALFIPLIDKKVKKAAYYKDKQPVTFKQDANGVFITLKEAPTEVDCVLELDI